MAFGSLKLNFVPFFFSDLGFSLPKEVFYSRDRSFFPLKTTNPKKSRKTQKMLVRGPSDSRWGSKYCSEPIFDDLSEFPTPKLV